MIDEAVVLAARSPAAASVARATVAGVTLIKRAIIVLARAGLERIVVVADAALGAELAADPDIAALAAQRTFVTSLADARAQVTGPFVLAPADTVFDVGFAKAVRAAHLGDHELAVASGVYVAAPVLLERGDDLAATLASARSTTLDTGEHLVADASTPEAQRAATNALFRSLGKRTDGPISRLINRPISTFVTRQLVNTNVTPNQMTVVANVVGAVGVVLVFQGTWALIALGALLVQLQSILDGCDGEIARLKFKSSRIGEWLDNVLDDQVNVGYGIALGFAGAALTGDLWWRWVGLGAGAAFMFHNLAFYWQLAFVHRSGNPFNFRWWFERPGVDVTTMLSKDTLGTKITAALRSLVRRDVFLFAFMGLAFAGLPHVAALWYALIAASQFGLMAVHLAKCGAPKSVAS